jgi:hypothetical protein
MDRDFAKLAVPLDGDLWPSSLANGKVPLPADRAAAGSLAVVRGEAKLGGVAAVTKRGGTEEASLRWSSKALREPVLPGSTKCTSFRCAMAPCQYPWKG